MSTSSGAGSRAWSRPHYEAASYYERWLFAAEAILAEKGVLSPGELDERLAP